MVSGGPPKKDVQCYGLKSKIDPFNHELCSILWCQTPICVQLILGVQAPVAQELRAALSQEGKVDVSTPRFCSFCSGSGTFDDDPEVPGSVVECTWCGGTGDAPQEGKAES